MLRRLSLGLLASAISLASLPAFAQENGSADDLGVMSINLKDVVKPTIGFQGALQGAGTPNQAGIGGFLPISVGENSVFFADVLANVNFADYGNDSSIINTKVDGATISTSSRLGYRWLNGDRSWMYGLNAGYDSRPMNSGGTDTGIPTFGTDQSAFFQQVAVNAEAVSNDWNINAYALIPVGDTEQQLNWYYQGGALDTYGLDVGYFITPAVNASVGYYYQNGDLGTADGSGVLGRVAYEISNGLIAGVNISYDEAFETRVSADLKVRFGGAKTTSQSKEVQKLAVINALTSTPTNRDVRVHDVACYPVVHELKGTKGICDIFYSYENAPDNAVNYWWLYCSDKSRAKGSSQCVREGDKYLGKDEAICKYNQKYPGVIKPEDMKGKIC